MTAGATRFSGLDQDAMAQRVADDIPAGSFVNLGIGLRKHRPTRSTRTW
jgi:acyl CoA:acetate/3-ketoacid CoA transferase beta subunit